MAVYVCLMYLCGIHQRQQQQQSGSRSFSRFLLILKNEISFRVLFTFFLNNFFFVLDMKTPKPLAVSSCSSITTHRHCCAYHLGTLLVLPCAVYPNTLLAMQMARFVSYTSSHHWLSISAIWISGGDGDEERRPWK